MGAGDEKKKPPHNLRDALSEARAVAGGQSSRPPPPASLVAPARKSVLVVEADPQARQALVTAIRALDLEVHEATDGVDAAEVLAKIAPPTLLVCDLTMPRMDGFALARMMKASPLLKSVGVMFVTARDSPQDVKQALLLGVRQYVNKPIAVPELASRIRKIVG